MKKIPDIAWAVFRIAVGVLFIGASLYKIATPGDFAHQIHNYKLLPPWAVNPLGIVLPWLQLFCGLSLVFNRLSRGGALLLAAMMLAFQVAVASALMRGLNISCGCFKAGGASATWWTFGRDFLIFAATVIQLIKSWPCQGKGPDRGNH